MNPIRKPRADSKLKTLPEHRQDAIADHALTHTLAETVGWLKQDGLEVSRNVLSEFLSWHRINQQLALNASAVNTVLVQLAKRDRSLTPERLQELGQVFFTDMAIQQKDQRAWVAA